MPDTFSKRPLIAGSFLNALLFDRVLQNWQNLSQIQAKIFVSKDDLLNHGKFQRILTFKWKVSV